MVTPADGAIGHAGFVGGFGVADFVAEVNGLARRNAAGLEHGAELRGLPKDGGAAREVLKERGEWPLK